MRPMNGSLDSFVDNLTLNLYNTKFKHFMKCGDCKKFQNYKDDGTECCETFKICKKLSTNNTSASKKLKEHVNETTNRYKK